jgi:hypothetical protein
VAPDYKSGTAPARTVPCSSASSELRRQYKQDAWQRLRGALGTAFGGFPHGVRTWPLVLRGEAGPELVSLASQLGDLLVIGGGRRTVLTRLVCCLVARHCLAHARCPVPAVPPAWPSTPATACTAGYSATTASTPARFICGRGPEGWGQVQGYIEGLNEHWNPAILAREFARLRAALPD